jgi:hypothetical protein
MALAHRPCRPEEAEEVGERERGGGGGSFGGTRRSTPASWQAHGENHNNSIIDNNDKDGPHPHEAESDDKERKRHRSFRRRVLGTVTIMALISISVGTFFYLTVPNPMQSLRESLRGAVRLEAIESHSLSIERDARSSNAGAKPGFSALTNMDRAGGDFPHTSGTAAPSDDSDDHPYPFLIGDGRFVPIPHLEGCSVSFQPPPPRVEESDWRLPLWVPSFPSSGASNPSNKGDLVRAMIGLLTGLSDRKPVKNYHVSMRNRLKRCRGLSETVACTQGHPLVPIGPEKQVENFQPHVIVPVRNFATAFPASFTDKNIAYHAAKGQSAVAEWRTMRDQYLQSSFESWKELILWWKHAEYYRVALYLPFEDVFRREYGAGTEIVKRLSGVLQNDAGFESATSQRDFECVWYQVYKDEWHRQQSLMEYIPPYTHQQQQWMMEGLREFQSNEKVSDDPVLVALLDRYVNQIARYTPLDGDDGDRSRDGAA